MLRSGQVSVRRFRAGLAMHELRWVDMLDVLFVRTIDCSSRCGSSGSPGNLRSTLLLLLWVLTVATITLACSPELDGDQASFRTEGKDEPGQLESRDDDRRPSVVLAVLDTLRADAVSSYGEVDGTTPVLDRLARKGVRFARAYASAPWTVSSHASLFTGLRVDQHGLGLGGNFVAPDSFRMLAEEFRAAGYETVGFSENSLVSHYFGFDQGFDHFGSMDIVATMRSVTLGEARPDKFDIVERVRAWSRSRERSKPFFLFVNLFDPHDPYEVRVENPWLPSAVSQDEARFVQSKYTIPSSLCDGIPLKKHIDILHGLYLGDVAEADRKLGSILRILDEDVGVDSYLIVATSDHGEHFGERRMMGHQFSVGNPVLHVPLIVKGIVGSESVVIEDPVETRDVRNSILCWALGRDCPAALPLEISPPGFAKSGAKPIYSMYSDSVSRLPDWLVDQFGVPDPDKVIDTARLKCDKEDRVFGDMVSLIRYPMKITWFSQNNPVLHDLSWDPAERFDQMKIQPEVAASLRREIEEFVRENVMGRVPEHAMPNLSREAAQALESLGYIR